MASEQKSHKSFPTILSKLRALKDLSGSADSREEGNRSARGEEGPGRGVKGEEGVKSRQERGPDPRGTPRPAWVARKDSTLSTVSSLNNNGPNGTDGHKSLAMLGRIPSLMSLGGASTAWGKRLKKKRDAEEYAAQKLARQKEEMALFYRGTPVTDDRATSTEILRFLYEMWEPQLCSSHRPHSRITTNCRQDLRSARRIAQTTSKRAAKLHRARVVIDLCHHMSEGCALEGRRPSSARPRSAKSVT